VGGNVGKGVGIHSGGVGDGVRQCAVVGDGAED
jgi:hypothetical protein